MSMILYNMRQRGTLEYDKFILNILQYHNEINNLFSSELGTVGLDMKSFTDYYNAINSQYGAIVGKTVPGFSETLYLKTLTMKES